MGYLIPFLVHSSVRNGKLMLLIFPSHLLMIEQSDTFMRLTVFQYMSNWYRSPSPHMLKGLKRLNQVPLISPSSPREFHCLFFSTSQRGQ
jgi:hypothetical protein